ncbi:hypothetical protein J2S02_003078 [Metabacillus niabensis]|uniref:Uncharacterized protein n=1 Tax=Metabacillus niabensis TaxID=324854 RepID=A0ABT9Z395_9BACI|nr:hypothetical protein [Metabacillus niabensis]
MEALSVSAENLQVEGAGGPILPAIINSLKKSQGYL